jgi:hypothetical protein
MFIAVFCRARACFTSSSISSMFGLNVVWRLPILRCTSVSFRSPCKFCNRPSDSAAQCLPAPKTLHKACPCVARTRLRRRASRRTWATGLHPWQLRHDLQRALDGAGQITAKRERRSPSPCLTLYGAKKTCHWHERCGSTASKGVPPGAEVAGPLTAYGLSAFASRIGNRGRWESTRQ